MSDPERDDLTAQDRELLARAVGAKPAPEPHWGSYAAQLRARLDARRRARSRWWARPPFIALSTGLAAALLLFIIQPTGRPPVNGDLTSVDEGIIGARLGLLEHYDVVERLDLLEELDVIRQLDTAPSRDG